MIEQAIFSMQSGAPERGYHLVATSPGLPEIDARELTNWGPGHGSLSGTSFDGASVNFHTLSSGSYCVSRSVVFGTPDSAIFGPRLYTQSLVVPPGELERFAHNPFQFLRAVRAKGHLRVLEPAHSPLASFRLPAVAPRVDEGLLAQFVDLMGADKVAWMVHVALTTPTIVLINAPSPEVIISGLLNCLPVECRPELSFTTGLKLSNRRPFRLHVTTAESARLNHLTQQPGVMIVDVEEPPPPNFSPSGWAGYLREAIQADLLACVCSELERPRPGLRLIDLRALATDLRENLCEASNVGAGSLESFDEPEELGAVVRQRHAQGAHGLLGPISGATRDTDDTDTVSSGAGKALSDLAPRTLDQLGELDDMVFDLLSGRSPDVGELSRIWPQLIAELPPNLVAESREQYLRYALKLWERTLDDGQRDPNWAVTTLEILCLLFGET